MEKNTWRRFQGFTLIKLLTAVTLLAGCEKDPDIDLTHTVINVPTGPNSDLSGSYWSDIYYPDAEIVVCYNRYFWTLNGALYSSPLDGTYTYHDELYTGQDIDKLYVVNDSLVAAYNDSVHVLYLNSAGKCKQRNLGKTYSNLTAIDYWNGKYYALGTGSELLVESYPYFTTLTYQSGATDLEPFGNYLAVSGTFSSPGRGVALWDGNQLTAAGTGLSGSVKKLQTFNNELWAIGSFSYSGDYTTELDHIARWNGSAWVAVPHDFNLGPNNFSGMKALGNRLFLGGDFYGIDSLICARFAYLENDEWKTLGNGLPYEMEDFFVISGKLLAKKGTVTYMWH